MQKSRIDKLNTFLIAGGAVILETTNEYEVTRFRTDNGVNVIYSSRKRGITCVGPDAAEAYDKFNKDNVWQMVRRKDKERKKIQTAILERDGPCCFFCGKETVEGEDRSIEHILSIAHGGNNNKANLTIACIPCNQAVGDMTVVEKIKYREERLKQ